MYDTVTTRILAAISPRSERSFSHGIADVLAGLGSSSRQNDPAVPQNGERDTLTGPPSISHPQPSQQSNLSPSTVPENTGSHNRFDPTVSPDAADDQDGIALMDRRTLLVFLDANSVVRHRDYLYEIRNVEELFLNTIAAYFSDTKVLSVNLNHGEWLRGVVRGKERDWNECLQAVRGSHCWKDGE